MWDRLSLTTIQPKLFEPTFPDAKPFKMEVTVDLKPRQYKPKVQVSCNSCGKEFDIWHSRLEIAKKKHNGNMYCSKECFLNNRKAFYEKFYYCDYCRKGIPKEEAVKRGNRLCCPKTDCHNNRLKRTNTRYRYRKEKQKEKI